MDNRILAGERILQPDIVLPQIPAGLCWGDFKVYSWGMSVYKSRQKYEEHVAALRFIYLMGDARPSDGKASFQAIRDFEEEARQSGLGDTFDAIIGLETMSVRELHTSAMALVWTKDRCIETVRSFPEGCRNVNWARANGKGLISAVKRYWSGRWDDFLRAAGLDPASERRQGPAVSREDTIAWLRRCHADGCEMSSAGLMALPRGNTYSAMLSRYFGGLRRACAELGLPYTPRRRPSGAAE